MEKLGDLTVSGKGLTDGDGVGISRGAGSFGGRGGNGNAGKDYLRVVLYITVLYRV